MTKNLEFYHLKMLSYFVCLGVIKSFNSMFVY